MKTLDEWLKSLPDMLKVQAGTLLLDGKEYEAAYYEQVREGASGCANPGKYISQNIYVVGERPKKLLKDKCCFTKEDDSREWYVSCFMDKKNFKPENEKFHPFGVSFILAPWTIPTEKIDHYERKPYIRLPLKFTPI